MTNEATGVSITHLGTVIIPVSDQDRALAFYVDKLGFEQRSDMPFGNGERWLEVAPPGATTTLALIPPREGGPHRDRYPRGLHHDGRRARSRKPARSRSRRGRGGDADGGTRAADVLLPRPGRKQVADRRAGLTRLGKVVAGLSMSLDGFVAGADDRFKPPARSLPVVEELFQCEANITGRRAFDIAGGWAGHHPVGAPFFGLTHDQVGQTAQSTLGCVRSQAITSAGLSWGGKTG